jgi:FkbM family methyltransferase
MLKRVQSVGLRVIRAAASLPLQALGQTECGRALEQLSAGMITTVNLPEGSLRFATSNPLLLARASSLLSKEPDTISWIDGFDATDVFWDVGANVGVFTLYAARRRNVRVLAFEPSADNYAVLSRNVELNALANRILSYCIALAGRTELGVLNSPSRQMGASLHQFGKPGETSRYWDGGGNICAQGMIGYTIDDFIRQFDPPFPSRLKLDVDGIEWPILQGAKNTLRDRRLRSVMAELPLSDDAERGRAVEWLSDAGLKLINRGEVQVAGDEAAANHFFERG